MGRIVSGTLASTVPSVGNIGIGSLVAGSAISINDMVLNGPLGKAFPAQFTDYAAVPNAGAQIFAQTSVIGGVLVNGGRYGLCQASDGSIYIAAHWNSSLGCRIFKYKADGTFVNGVTVNNSGSQNLGAPFLFELANGNIAVVYALSTNPVNLRHAVVDKNLTVVGVDSVIEPVKDANIQGFCACALSGGGYAVVYQYHSTNTQEKLAIYSNTGSAVLAPTVIQTWVGTAGDVRVNIAQLPNGNILIAANSLFTTTVGTYHAIYTATGTQVKAFTQLTNVLASASNRPEISIMADRYAIARSNDNVDWKAWVLDLSGNLQGTEFSVSSGASSSWNRSKLLNDGTNFYLLMNLGLGAQTLITLPKTGTNFVNRLTTLSASVTAWDAFYERGFITIISAVSGANKNNFAVLDTVTGMVFTSTTDFGIAAGTSNNGQMIIAIPGGDFTFITVFDYASPGSTNLFVGKYANSAIAGVALAAAAAGVTATLAEGIGTYQINPLRGATVKAFDHNSGANIQGNKGTLLTNAAVLRGI